MPPAARRTLVLELTDEKFVDDNYDVSVGNGSIVLTNWSDGHNHLYFYRYDETNPGNTEAKLERQLTDRQFRRERCARAWITSGN